MGVKHTVVRGASVLAAVSSELGTPPNDGYTPTLPVYTWACAICCGPLGNGL